MYHEEEIDEASNALIKIERYKCFSNAGDFFSITSPITLLFGPNGSGKTALVEVFKRKLAYGKFIIKGKLNLIGACKLVRQAIEAAYPDLPADTFLSAKRIMQNNSVTAMSSTITHTLNNDRSEATSFEGPVTNALSAKLDDSGFAYNFEIKDRHIYQLDPKDFEGQPISFVDVISTRRIEPEGEQEPMNANGAGTTSKIFKWQIERGAPTVDMKKELISAFNTIVDDHERIADIRAVEHKNYEHGRIYEIEFEYKEGAKPSTHVLLQETGAGFQTILMCIIALIGGRDQSPLDHHQSDTSQWDATLKYTYNAAFGDSPWTKPNKQKRLLIIEELETHLHPNTIRRLLDFIFEKKTDQDQLLLTSHSPIVLDYVASKQHTQLLNLQVRSGQTVIRRLADAKSRFLALSELGSMPSDLCLSNGVVWVEGPSDRIYVNWWIEHFSEGQLREGAHYMVMWMGGSNVANVEFDDSFEVTDDIVNLVRINPNHHVIVDSDLHSGRDEHKPSVTKLKAGLAANKLWITDVPEIENYIPVEIIRKAEARANRRLPAKSLPFTPRRSTKGANVWQALTGLKTLDKMDLARKIASEFPYKIGDTKVKDLLSQNEEFRGQIDNLVERIRLWNGMPPKSDRPPTHS